METEHGVMRFSVVVPAYNEADYLTATIESLLRQDFPGRYEVIVVDNDSTDGTAAAAAAYGVRVVSEPRRGVCAARQRGVEAATGEIIVSTDADTVQPVDWLRTIDERFAASESVIAVAGPCRYQNPSWWAKTYPVLLFGAVAGIFAATGYVCYFTATNVAMRRSAFPGYDLRQTQGGDELDLLRRLRRRGRVVWVRTNVVTTSARRLERGLIYTLVVSLFVHYLLAYVVNRVSSRPRFGMAPAIRSAPSRRRFRRLGLGLVLVAAASAGAISVGAPDALGTLSALWAGR